MRVLLLACSLVWPLSAPPAASAAPARKAVTVRVASYNTWLLPVVSKRLGSRKHKLPKAVAAVAPDVACFQEVWLSGHQKELARALRRRLPHVAYGSGGLMVLSRLPIGRSSFHPFPVHADLPLHETLAAKGYLEVDIGTPAGPLRIVNSHLALDRSARRLGHAAQLAALVAGIGKARREFATVLCADLNLSAWRGSKPTAKYKSLLDLGLVAANTRPRQPTRIGWPRPRHGTGRGWSPDFVMARSGRRVSAAVTSFRRALHTRDTALSDHDLLVVDLKLTAQQ